VSGAAGPLIVTSLDDVRGCLPLPRAMDLVEDALRDRRSARIVPVTLALDDGAGFRVVAGATGGAAVVRFGAAGRFWATGATRPNTWAAVFDPGTGELLALLRFPFADLRVAATLGAAARTLTAGPVPVTMIGAGNYAFTVLETLHAGTGIASLTVVSRTRWRPPPSSWSARTARNRCCRRGGCAVTSWSSATGCRASSIDRSTSRPTGSPRTTWTWSPLPGWAVHIRWQDPTAGWNAAPRHSATC
jgi:ornithine cyclodeaminase/alanine dehydrogenase-like protein (mu-crystallin family)